MNERVRILLKKGLRFTANQYYRATYAKYLGHGYTCNFCGARYGRFVPEYPDAAIEEALRDHHVVTWYGPNVYCPGCLSTNSERLMKAVIQHYVKIEGRQALHFSPEKRLRRWLKKKISMTVATHADATRLVFPDDSFSLLIASNILEQVPEDSRAMQEMWRVLKKDGVAILQTAYSETLSSTLEEPAINDPIRQTALFGHKDHVRIYAKQDYIDRLEKANFRVKVLTPEALAPFRAHAIQEDQSVFLCYK